VITRLHGRRSSSPHTGSDSQKGEYRSGLAKHRRSGSGRWREGSLSYFEPPTSPHSRNVASALESKYRPAATTPWISRTLRMSRRGSRLRSTRSACIPGLTSPISPSSLTKLTEFSSDCAQGFLCLIRMGHLRTELYADPSLSRVSGGNRNVVRDLVCAVCVRVLGVGALLTSRLERTRGSLHLPPTQRARLGGLSHRDTAFLGICGRGSLMRNCTTMQQIARLKRANR
jgi:hypothetical protein